MEKERPKPTHKITEEEVKEYFDIGKEMFEKSKKIYNLVDEFTENREYSNEYSLEELDRITKEIAKLKIEKEKLIKTAIGFMYNGILVDGELSCRRGEVYKFRCQYSLSLQRIKKELMKAISEVSTKLSSPNLDTLEVLLEMVEEEDEEITKTYNLSYSEKNNLNTKELRLLTPFIVAQFKKGSEIEFETIGGIGVKNDGEILVYDEHNNRAVDLDAYSKYMCVAKLKNEFDELSKEYLEQQTKKHNELTNQIQTIKQKAQNLLMLSEIMPNDKARVY